MYSDLWQKRDVGHRYVSYQGQSGFTGLTRKEHSPTPVETDKNENHGKKEIIITVKKKYWLGGILVLFSVVTYF